MASLNSDSTVITALPMAASEPIIQTAVETASSVETAVTGAGIPADPLVSQKTTNGKVARIPKPLIGMEKLAGSARPMRKRNEGRKMVPISTVQISDPLSEHGLPEPKYPVFIVKYRMSSTAVVEFINSRTAKETGHLNVGLARVWLGFDGKDTGLFLVLADKQIYPILCAKGYGPGGKYRSHFKITPFDVRDYQYPKSNYTEDIFVPIPPEIRGSGDAAIIFSIGFKLEHAAGWGVIPMNSWEIAIPVSDRNDSTTVKGLAFIKFHSDQVSVNDIAVMRVILDAGVWTEYNIAGALQDSKYPFTCRWARRMHADAELKHTQQARERKSAKRRTTPLTPKAGTDPKLSNGASSSNGSSSRSVRPVFSKEVSLVDVVQPQLRTVKPEPVAMAPIAPVDLVDLVVISQPELEVHPPALGLTRVDAQHLTVPAMPAVQPVSLPAVQPLSLPAVQPLSLPAVQPLSLPAVQSLSLPAVQPVMPLAIHLLPPVQAIQPPLSY
jgi:hypothetical protein